MEDFLIDDSASIAYLYGSQAGVIMGDTSLIRKNVTALVNNNNQTSAKSFKTKDGSTPSVDNKEPVIFDLQSVGGVAYWGVNNLFPQDIIRLASVSTELPSLLDWKARAAQGAEALPFNRKWNKDTRSFDEELIEDPDILAFFLNENTKRYYRESYMDFMWYQNIFPDLIVSKDRATIAEVHRHDASWCRWQKMLNDGTIPGCVVASNWMGGMTGKSIYMDIHPVVNPKDWDLIDKLRSGTINRFVYPVSYPSPGKAYYSLSSWDGIRTSGWLELASLIPSFKRAIMNNQMHIKYLIRIPTNYWPAVYDDWHTVGPAIQSDRKRAKLKEVNDSLTGVDKAGKSILNEVGYDTDGKILPGWEIIVIDDKLKDGAYIEDSQEASAHLLRALGLDGTLVGQGPGRNLNAGGGTDKLVAFNMYCALQTPFRDIVNEPIRFACRYNGWYERYPLMFIKTFDAEPAMPELSKKVNTNSNNTQANPNTPADAISR